jgi:hypothetical protein
MPRWRSREQNLVGPRFERRSRLTRSRQAAPEWRLPQAPGAPREPVRRRPGWPRVARLDPVQALAGSRPARALRLIRAPASCRSAPMHYAFLTSAPEHDRWAVRARGAAHRAVTPWGAARAKPGRARAPPRAGQLGPAVRPVAPSVALVDSGRRAGAAAEEAVGRRRCSAPADCQRLAVASARLGPPERRRVERRQRRAAERARHPGLRLRRAVGPPGRRTGSSKPPGSRKDRQARRQPGYCLRSLCLSRGEWWRGLSGFQPMNQGTGGGLARQARRRRTTQPRWPPQNNSASLSVGLAFEVLEAGSSSASCGALHRIAPAVDRL